MPTLPQRTVASFCGFTSISRIARASAAGCARNSICPKRFSTPCVKVRIRRGSSMWTAHCAQSSTTSCSTSSSSCPKSRDQADLLVQIVRRNSADVDRIENRFLSQRPTQNRLDLGAMRRTLTRLQRMLAPEPGAIFRLLARPPRWLYVEEVQDLRESTEEFSVVLSDVAGLIERVRLLRRWHSARREQAWILGDGVAGRRLYRADRLVGI
ncbi:hypothetical protein QFZ97_004333 [Paraburkholderia youngii]